MSGLTPDWRHPLSLDGHVSVVTGGTSGIGLGIAAGLAAAGASVAVWGRDARRGRDALDRLTSLGARACFVACDVTDAVAVQQAMAKTVEALGPVGSCFANAGAPASSTRFVDMSLSEFRAVLSVNLEGTFLTLQAAAREMVSGGGGGSLVAVTSISAFEGHPRGQHYAAAKAGINALVRSCAVEFARHRIRANAIAPGWIATPMSREAHAVPAVQERILPRIPAGRWGVPADLAGVAIYLASDASSYHTGDTIVVDGGYGIF